MTNRIQQANLLSEFSEFVQSSSRGRKTQIAERASRSLGKDNTRRGLLEQIIKDGLNSDQVEFASLVLDARDQNLARNLRRKVFPKKGGRMKLKQKLDKMTPEERQEKISGGFCSCCLGTGAIVLMMLLLGGGLYIYLRFGSVMTSVWGLCCGSGVLFFALGFLAWLFRKHIRTAFEYMGFGREDEDEDE